MKNKKLILSISMILGIWILGTNNASATTWYVRDGGGSRSECTGTSNAVYPGSGSNQACAFSNPMYVLGAGCGNTGGNTCDVPGVMQSGDILYIVGDSDINSGSQAQYPIGLDTTGVITPTNGNNCYLPVPENCTMGNIPSNSSVIGIGTHRPQLWGREHVAQVLNDNNSTSTVINNLEITQHSACVYNGTDPNGTTDGFPDACHTSDAGFSSPYGNWGLAGMSLTGNNIILENSWIHGMAQWGVTTGSLTNFTEENNVINGNGGGGMGLGQNLSNAGTMTLGGTTTVTNEIIVFNGCGSDYPLHSSDPFDTLNYHNCADDSSSNGTILADGWAMEAGSGVCNNVIMTNDNVSYNTKGGIDNLHCNGTGTFHAYRVRAEGNESQQMKINYANAYIENSQIINDCNYFEGQPFTTTCDAYGNCPPSLGYDFCRAAGDGLRIAVVDGGNYNISNSTLYSNGGANIELPPVTCNSSSVVNVNNNLVINAPDYTNSDTQNTDFWENDTGTCNPIVENNNLVYQANDASHCAGSHDICSNPSNAGVTGNFALNSSYVYPNTGLADQLYPSSSGPLLGAANNSMTLSGTSNDYNNYARATTWDIGAYQHGSSVANGGTCFLNGECASGSCSSSVCAASGPVITLTSSNSGANVLVGANVTITATASETNGNIANVSLYNGGILLGSSNSSTINYIDTNLLLGSYTIYAVATDAYGVSTTSSPITITAVLNPILPSLPTVAITNPANGSTFSAGSNTTITTTASENNGTISNISLYYGAGILLGSSSTSPFNYVASNLLAGNYTLYAVATDVNGVSTTSSSVSVTVTAPAAPVVTITTPVNGGTITPGSTFTITANASEANGTIAQVQFYESSTLLETVTTPPYSISWTNSTRLSYSLTAKAIDANGVSTTSGVVNITVTNAPSITSQPVNVTVTAPATASFTVAATGTPAPTYQWMQSVNGGAFTNIAGATSASYTTAATTTANSGNQYECVVTNASGSVTSSAATLTVNPTPVAVGITSQPVNVTVTAPATASFTVAATGTPAPTYQWMQSVNGGAFTNIAGATSASYTTAATTTANSGTQYECVVTNASGSVTSSAVTLTVNPTPVAVSITSQPVNVTVTAPATASFTVAATGTPAPTYQWMQSVNGGAFTNIAGATSASYTTAATTTANSGTQYECVVTNASGSVTSSAVTLTVNPTPVAVSITSQPVNVTVTAPATASFTVAATGTPAPTYQWMQSVNGGAFTNIAGATSASYTTAATTTANSGTQYECVVTNASGSLTSNAATLIVTSLPAIVITSPANGSNFTAGDNVTINVNAVETNGTIANVAFYYNGTDLLGSSVASPFSYTAANIPAGTYTLTAIATDTRGVSTTSSPITVTITTSRPVVAITSPANGSSFPEGSYIGFTTSAAEINGTITQVQYFSGSTLIGGSLTSPYIFGLANVPAGNYIFTAKATDANGIVVASSPVTVTVLPGTPPTPTVALTSPTNNSTVTAGSTITFTANAAETNGRITQVQYFSGSTLIGGSLTSPYIFGLTNVPAGSYVFTAKATDANGVTVVSSPVAVTVTSLPVVALTSPANGSSFPQGSYIGFTTNATETNGTITQVQYFSGSALIGGSLTPPYIFGLSNVPVGNYTFTAKAMDANGVTVFSSPITVTVVPGIPPTPTVALTSPADGSSFTAGSPINFTANASETNGSITQVQYFSGSTLIGGSLTSPYIFGLANIPVGTYTFTAKAMDANGVTVTSSPVTVTVTNASSPTVAITSPANGSSFPEGSYIGFTASATESNGTITQVQYFSGSTLIGGSLTSPYIFGLANVPAGNYTFIAKAMDANGVVVASSPVTVTVVAGIPPQPVVALASPSDGSNFTAGSTINLTTNATETNGIITQVQYFNGSTLIGGSLTAPYIFSLTNVPAGSYTFTAKAMDANGVVVASSPVTVTVSQVSSSQ